MNPRHIVLARSWIHGRTQYIMTIIQSWWMQKSSVDVIEKRELPYHHVSFHRSVNYYTYTWWSLSFPKERNVKRLLVSLTSLSASRWRRANFFQYNRKPHLEMAKPWVTKWRGYCVCSKTPHESHQVKPLSAKHVAADQSHADSDNSYYHFLLWPNGNGLTWLLKGATKVARDMSEGTPQKQTKESANHKPIYDNSYCHFLLLSHSGIFSRPSV